MQNTLPLPTSSACSCSVKPGLDARQPAPLLEPSLLHLGACQNYGPFLGTLNIRCRIIIGTQKGTIILTSTHLNFEPPPPSPACLSPWPLWRRARHSRNMVTTLRLPFVCQEFRTTMVQAAHTPKSQQKSDAIYEVMK